MSLDTSSLVDRLLSGHGHWPSLGRAWPSDATADWRSFWDDCARTGILGLHVPQSYGGAGLSAAETVELLMDLGRICLANALPMAVNSQIWVVQEPLLRFGTDAQKEHYLPRLISGEMIAAFAMTEADTGSDVMALQTRAHKTDGGYVLQGAKCYSGLATECDVALVFASTAPERKSWGLSAFLVHREDIGFHQGPEQKKMGLTELPMGEMSFVDCEIPESRRLGPEGAGASIFQATMELERSFLFATQVGAMQRQLEAAVEFAQNRIVFDKPIAEFQSVSNRLADMAVRLETCLMMQRKAAAMHDAGELTMLQASITKLHISEAFLASSLDAVRVHGGRGYLAGATSGADARDALGGVIYSGTSDVQRNVIARMLAVGSPGKK